MARARRLLVWAGIFILGLLLGPLLLALIAGLTASADENVQGQTAYRLLKAYDERYPDYALSSRDWQSAASDCGYDFEQVFGSATPPLAEGRGWSPFTGYFDLILWRSGEFREEVERRRVEHLMQQLSGFELTFLDSCIRRTMFAGLCGRRVGTALEQAALDSPAALPAAGPRFDQTRESATLCRYLDGIAARQGQPLASPAGPSAAE